MSLSKRAGIYHYDFYINKKRYQGSCRTSDRLKAEVFEQEEKAKLGKETRPRKETKEPGVYFVLSTATGLVKVGCSGNLTERLKDLDDSGAEYYHLLCKLPILEYQSAEKVFHEFFEAYWEKGEWYRISTRHIEAAILFWATGHPMFEKRVKMVPNVEVRPEAGGLPS